MTTFLIDDAVAKCNSGMTMDQVKIALFQANPEHAKAWLEYLEGNNVPVKLLPLIASSSARELSEMEEVEDCLQFLASQNWPESAKAKEVMKLQAVALSDRQKKAVELMQKYKTEAKAAVRKSVLAELSVFTDDEIKAIAAQGVSVDECRLLLEYRAKATKVDDSSDLGKLIDDIKPALKAADSTAKPQPKADSPRPFPAPEKKVEMDVKSNATPEPSRSLPATEKSPEKDPVAEKEEDDKKNSAVKPKKDLAWLWLKKVYNDNQAKPAARIVAVVILCIVLYAVAQSFGSTIISGALSLGSYVLSGQNLPLALVIGFGLFATAIVFRGNAVVRRIFLTLGVAFVLALFTKAGKEFLENNVKIFSQVPPDQGPKVPDQNPVVQVPPVGNTEFNPPDMLLPTAVPADAVTIWKTESKVWNYDWSTVSVEVLTAIFDDSEAGVAAYYVWVAKNVDPDYKYLGVDRMIVFYDKVRGFTPDTRNMRETQRKIVEPLRVSVKDDGTASSDDDLFKKIIEKWKSPY